jgi:hypothetical protein
MGRGRLTLAALFALSCGGREVTVPAPAPPPVPSRGSLGKVPRGRLDPAVIQRIVRSDFDAMKACYADGLRRNPHLTGKISTRFVIERDGHVSSAADADNTPPANEIERHLRDAPPSISAPAAPRFPDPAVTSCVVARFAELKFPEPEGGIVTVVYPVIFSPED